VADKIMVNEVEKVPFVDMEEARKACKPQMTAITATRPATSSVPTVIEASAIAASTGAAIASAGNHA
jgi:hypothetical protein